MGLTDTEILEVIAHCDYKPGYVISVLDMSPERVTFKLSALGLLDTVAWKHDMTSRQIALDFKVSIERYRMRSLHELLGIIQYDLLGSMEMHEMDEWFYYFGQRVGTVHGVRGCQHDY